MNVTPVLVSCLAVGAALLAACGDDAPSSGSSSSSSGQTGTEPGGAAAGAVPGACFERGQWRLVYTRKAESSPLCEDLKPEDHREGAVFGVESSCEPGCTCTDDVANFPTCSVHRAVSCTDETERKLDVKLTRSSSKAFAGTVTVTVTAASLTCLYDLRYDWVGP